MTDARSSPATEQDFLEDNIATLAFHLGQPGARLSVQHWKSGVIIEPGEVLKEASRRLGLAQSDHEGPARVERVETTGQLPPVPSPGSEYVLMPKEATRTMTMAGCDSLPSCEHVFGYAGEMLRNAYRKMVEVGSVDVAQAAPEPAITDAMVEAGARVAATRRGHKDCDHLVATVNAGRVPVWEFYTEEPRAILEAALALSSTPRETPELADRWPLGCHSPNSCSRNGRCMYFGCRHDGKDIKALATAFSPATRETPMDDLTGPIGFQHIETAPRDGSWLRFRFRRVEYEEDVIGQWQNHADMKAGGSWFDRHGHYITPGPLFWALAHPSQERA